MTIFYIKTKIRAGGGALGQQGGALGQQGGALGQQGAPPCYSSLWETLYKKISMKHKQLKESTKKHSLVTLSKKFTGGLKHV